MDVRERARWQLLFVRCTRCGWQGREDETQEGKCPRCGSKDLEKS